MPLKLTTYYRGSRIPELPGTDTFHSTELFRIYEATPGYTPLLIVASEGGVPVAKLLAAVRKSTRLFPPAIIKRCEVYGIGEYFDEAIDKETVFSDMLQRLTDEACGKHSLSNSVTWTTRCPATRFSAGTVTSPSTGYASVTRCTTRNRWKNASAPRASAKSGKG